MLLRQPTRSTELVFLSKTGKRESLLQAYGHIDLIALAEVDALYESNVVPLRSASDATPTQEASEPAL